MSAELTALLFGALGTAIGAGIHYAFQRHSATRQERKEIIEAYLLQLQNSVESLYYRAHNLQKRQGRAVMSEEYYRLSNVYILGRVLAHESLLVSKGIYAKLDYDEDLKQKIKRGLHAINWALADTRFQHYYRVQIGEMLLDGDRILSYTEYLERRDQAPFRKAVEAAEHLATTLTSDRLETIGQNAAALVELLEKQTKVPSALTLSEPIRKARLSGGGHAVP